MHNKPYMIPLVYSYLNRICGPWLQILQFKLCLMLSNIHVHNMYWNKIALDNSAPDKRGTEDNSKITFLISQPKHML